VVAAEARTTGLHRMETEDYVSALVRLGNGAPGTITATTAFVPGHPERIEIIGRKGSANLVGAGFGWIISTERVRSSRRRAPQAAAQHHGFPIDAHRALIGDFWRRAGRTGIRRSQGRMPLASQRLVDEVCRAAKSDSRHSRACWRSNSGDQIRLLDQKIARTMHPTGAHRQRCNVGPPLPSFQRSSEEL
jgi:predicted dehydrogenase